VVASAYPTHASMPRTAATAAKAVSWSMKIRHGERNTSQPYSKIPITPTATRPTPTALSLPMSPRFVRFLSYISVVFLVILLATEFAGVAFGT